MAAHCDSYWLPASSTMRTARSITSGEYFDFFHGGSISQILEPPSNPGQFKRSSAHPWDHSLYLRAVSSSPLVVDGCSDVQRKL